MLALSVQGELMEFDRLRYMLLCGGSDTEMVDRFLEDGVFSFESIIGELHGEHDGHAIGTNRWMKFAHKSRKELGRQNGLLRRHRAPLLPREEDAEYLNRAEPHLSFTGNPELRAKLAAEGGLQIADEDESYPIDENLADDEAFECPTCGEDFADMTSYLAHHETAH